MAERGEETGSSLERARVQAEEALAGGNPSHLPVPAGSPARVSRTFAWLLDDLAGVPGTRIRFGVDPVLSFIPMAGTAVGAALGSVILYDAVRLRTPISVLTRMVGNYVFDWTLGLVPFLGAFLDAAFRSNHKNFTLLERTIADREQVRRASLWYWAGVALLTAVVLGVLLAAPIALLLWLDRAVTGG